MTAVTLWGTHGSAQCQLWKGLPILLSLKQLSPAFLSQLYCSSLDHLLSEPQKPQSADGVHNLVGCNEHWEQKKQKTSRCSLPCVCKYCCVAPIRLHMCLTHLYISLDVVQRSLKINSLIDVSAYNLTTRNTFYSICFQVPTLALSLNVSDSALWTEEHLYVVIRRKANSALWSHLKDLTLLFSLGDTLKTQPMWQAQYTHQSGERWLVSHLSGSEHYSISTDL